MNFYKNILAVFLLFFSTVAYAEDDICIFSESYYIDDISIECVNPLDEEYCFIDEFAVIDYMLEDLYDIASFSEYSPRLYDTGNYVFYDKQFCKNAIREETILSVSFSSDKKNVENEIKNEISDILPVKKEKQVIPKEIDLQLSDNDRAKEFQKSEEKTEKTELISVDKDNVKESQKTDEKIIEPQRVEEKTKKIESENNVNEVKQEDIKVANDIETENSDSEIEDIELRNLNQQIKRDDTNLNLYYKRALYYSKKRMYGKAVLEYDWVLEFKPMHEGAYYHRADAKFNLGDSAGALEDLKRAIDLKPSEYSYLLRGNIKANKKDYIGAIDDECARN